MRKYNNFATLLLQSRQKSIAILIFIFFYFSSMDLGQNEKYTTLFVYYLVSFYLFVIANGFRDGVSGIQNDFEVSYKEQIQSYYYFAIPTLVMFMVFVLSLAQILNSSFENFWFELICVIFVFIPFTMASLFMFMKNWENRLVLGATVLGLNGTLTWLFFNNMRPSGNLMTFEIAGNMISLHFSLVVLLLIVYFILVIYVTSRVALKLYKPKLVGGIQ